MTSNDELIERLREEADNLDHCPSVRELLTDAASTIDLLLYEIAALNEELALADMALTS